MMCHCMLVQQRLHQHFFMFNVILCPRASWLKFKPEHSVWVLADDRQRASLREKPKGRESESLKVERKPEGERKKPRGGEEA